MHQKYFLRSQEVTPEGKCDLAFKILSWISVLSSDSSIYSTRFLITTTLTVISEGKQLKSASVLYLMHSQLVKLCGKKQAFIKQRGGPQNFFHI